MRLSVSLALASILRLWWRRKSNSIRDHTSPEARDICGLLTGKLVTVFSSVTPNVFLYLSRSGYYELSEADNVEPGTKIVMHLKSGESVEFSDETKVKGQLLKF